MPRGNIDNLISNPERTPEELSNMGKKGGAASGKARREKKLFQNAVLAALQAKGKSGNTLLEEIVAAQIKRALKGDTRAFDSLRDTSGEKPTDKVEASVTSENKELMREYLDRIKKEK